MDCEDAGAAFGGLPRRSALHGVPPFRTAATREVMKRPRGLSDLDRVEAVFAALAHPNRRQILTVLRARGGTMTSGELASRFSCSWPTTTRHLGVLSDAKLVQIQRSGRERHYSLNSTELQTVAGAWLDRFRPEPIPPSADQ